MEKNLRKSPRDNVSIKKCDRSCDYKSSSSSSNIKSPIERNVTRKLVDRTTKGSVKYSHSSHLISCAEQESSNSSNHLINQSLGHQSKIPRPFNNECIYLLPRPRSRSSSPRSSLRYKSSIRILAPSVKALDLPSKIFPKKNQKSLACDDDKLVLDKGDYSSFSGNNRIISQINHKNIDSLKENLDYVDFIKSQAMFIKRRPSDLTSDRFHPREEHTFISFAKPLRSASNLEPKKASRSLSRYSENSDKESREKRSEKSTGESRIQGNSDHLAAMDLIRIGSRRLWCEVPQVKELGLLRELSVSERQLQEAMFEVISSEASYLKSLDILVNHFSNNILLSNPVFMDSSKKQDLFSNVSIVRDVSYQLMSVFEMKWKQSVILTDVCDILLEFALHHFDPYVSYCRYKKRQEKTLEELKSSPKFSEVLRTLESQPITQGLTLHSYLLLPIQRVTRYPLLIEAILKRMSDCTQYTSCQKVLSVVNKLVTDCNNAANQYEKYLAITTKLKFNSVRSFNLDEPRWYLGTYEVTKLKPEYQSNILIGSFRASHLSKSQMYIIALSDIIIIAKKKGDDFLVHDYCYRDLVQIKHGNNYIFNCKPPENFKNLLKMIFLHNHVGKRTEYSFNFSSQEEKCSCIEAIEPMDNCISSDEVYESYGYPWIPLQYSAECSQEIFI